MKNINLSIIIRFFLLVVIILGLNLILRNHDKPPKEDKYGSIVRLTMDGRTFCSGTVITPTTVLTAAHCMLIETPFGLVENKDIEVRPMDNTDLGLKVAGYYATAQLDQGLLEGDFSKFDTRPYITDVKRLVNLKDNYFKACGYPMGGKFYCGLLEYKDLLNFMWATTGVLIPGMSGGPVLLRDGTVVAVNVAVDGNRAVVSPIYNLDEYIK